MYLLDTNIVSTLDPRRGAEFVDLLRWMERNGRSLYLSVVTPMELRTGILMAERRGPSRRTSELRRFLETVLASFGDRALAVSLEIALAAADLTEKTRAFEIETADLLIAATAQVHGMTVLTRNLRHFAPTGVAALDPLAGLPPDV